MTDSDIVEFYPGPVCVHEKMREMFVSYGTCGSINVKPSSAEEFGMKKKRQTQEGNSCVQDNLAVEFQCQITRGCYNELFATHSSCPLLPPNASTSFL